VDIGGGTGHYLAAVLDALPEAQGLVLDLSRDAARVAARAHPRMAAVVCDVRHRLPVQDAAASLVLDVFAPRNGAEMRRIIAPDGRLIVVTPTQTHLRELGGMPGMLRVDAHKDERLERSMAGYFTPAEHRPVTWRMSLDRAAVRDVVLMGPSAHHVRPETLDQALAATDDPLDMSGAVDCSVWLPA
jgi:23S rRNA (guanine745-N1)-methyltransferase